MVIFYRVPNVQIRTIEYKEITYKGFYGFDIETGKKRTKYSKSFNLSLSKFLKNKCSKNIFMLL